MRAARDEKGDGLLELEGVAQAGAHCIPTPVSADSTLNFHVLLYGELPASYRCPGKLNNGYKIRVLWPHRWHSRRTEPLPQSLT